MNDIESTIDYIKTNYEKLNIGIDYSNGKDHTTITLFDKQAELVIKTLQEKAEREKGCEYCNEYKSISSCFTEYSLEISNGEISIWNGLRCEASFLINYCPHCGRKLGENNDT